MRVFVSIVLCGAVFLRANELGQHHLNKTELNARIGTREVNIKIGVLNAENRENSHFWIEFDPQCKYTLNDANMLLPYIVGTDKSQSSTDFHILSVVPGCSSANAMTNTYTRKYEQFKTDFIKNVDDWISGESQSLCDSKYYCMIINAFFSKSQQRHLVVGFKHNTSCIYGRITHEIDIRMWRYLALNQVMKWHPFH